MAKSKVRKSRRKFTAEYEQAAVALVTVDGHSFREASASLGVSEPSGKGSATEPSAAPVSARG